MKFSTIQHFEEIFFEDFLFIVKILIYHLLFLCLMYYII
jgi:hypothetical protein